MQRKTQAVTARVRECFFCINALSKIDYKNTNLLKRFLSSYVKILPKRRTGTCAKHQRKLAEAIKRARIMALLPYIPR